MNKTDIFLKKLKELLKEYNAKIRCELGEFTDFDGIDESIMLISMDEIDIFGISGWEITPEDLEGYR